jgi:chromosome condensin MukBEF ATPase and DNA-binding subunit MukB
MDIKEQIESQLKELEVKWNDGQKQFRLISQQLVNVRDSLIAIKAQYDTLAKLVNESPTKEPKKTE